jgi:WD40 repeat protein
MANFNSNETVVLTACADGIARLWNIADGHLLKQFDGHGSALVDGVFCGQYQTVFTLDDGGSGKLWNIGTGVPSVLNDEGDFIRFHNRPTEN